MSAKKKAAAGLGVAALLSAAVLSVLAASRPGPQPVASFSNAERLIDMQKCAECHEDVVERFPLAPHSQSIRSLAADAELRRRFAGREVVLNAEEGPFRYEERDGQLWVSAPRYPDPMRLDWAFGSGHHAITLVSVVDNPDGELEIFEHRVSWYPGDVLDTTFGQFDESAPGITTMAQKHSASVARECFGCHGTYLPIAHGRAELNQLVPGVTCTRCHLTAKEHVPAAEADLDDLLIERWSELDPLESVNRCGQCHRRADNFTAEELTVHNDRLIRFAPASIVHSKCFAGQGSVRLKGGDTARLVCTTCHDPHKPTETDPGFYRQQCFECHREGGETPGLCPAAPADSDCVGCHMPKVEIQRRLRFTDHWIRVRREGEPAAVGE
jgi:hypothetical protein